MYLKALVTNWSADLLSWQTKHAVPPERMLMVSMLHQCSGDAASRRLALDLAKSLRGGVHPLDAGSALPKHEFVGLSSCVSTALVFSSTLAKEHSAQLAEPLLRELVGLAQARSARAPSASIIRGTVRALGGRVPSSRAPPCRRP